MLRVLKNASCSWNSLITSKIFLLFSVRGTLVFMLQVLGMIDYLSTRVWDLYGNQVFVQIEWRRSKACSKKLKVNTFPLGQNKQSLFGNCSMNVGSFLHRYNVLQRPEGSGLFCFLCLPISLGIFPFLYQAI